MTITREHLLAEVRRLIQDGLHGRDADVYLYGSWAQGTPRQSSDVDIGVDSKAPLPSGLLARLREQLEESHVPYRVEIIDLSAVDPRFRKTVIQHGIRWNG